MPVGSADGRVGVCDAAGIDADQPPGLPAIDLARYPLHRPVSAEYQRLVERCRSELAAEGTCSLPSFVAPADAAAVAAALEPRFATEAFRHARRHNIWFDPEAPVPADHPALTEVETSSHTLCADQLAGTLIDAVYRWPPLAAFLAAVVGVQRLHVMADPLAALNAMAYRDGQALNWHFDRSEFTTTLLLQRPQGGGRFEYRRGLRDDHGDDLDGIARLVQGDDPQVQVLDVEPGTLNVFRGKHTAHRVTPAAGDRPRIIAVLSFYERPDVTMSAGERLGFYGRAEALTPT